MRALPIISYSIQQTHSFHMDQINGRRKFCNTSQTHVRACLKNLPKLIATIKGHLNKHQMNPQSNNPREETPPPLNNSTNQRTNIVITKDFQLSGQRYTDLPGRLLTKYSQGNSYILLLYDYKRNTILVKTMKTRTAPEWLQ